MRERGGDELAVGQAAARRSAAARHELDGQARTHLLLLLPLVTAPLAAKGARMRTEAASSLCFDCQLAAEGSTSSLNRRPRGRFLWRGSRQQGGRGGIWVRVRMTRE